MAIAKLYPSPLSDPFDMRNPGALQTTEFYDFREPISNDNIMDALRLATSNSLRYHGSSLIATGEVQFWSGEVQLILYPGENLTWRMWSAALVSMKVFVKNRGMAFGWSFIILEEGKLMMIKNILREVSYLWLKHGIPIATIQVMLIARMHRIE